MTCFKHLLHCEQILYTVIPIEHREALETSYKQQRQVATHIVLINCAGTLDIIDVLQPPENAVFYLIDSMRPLEVRNVYNGVQIKIIVLNLEAEQKLVPDFEDIFDEEELEAANNENDGENDDDAGYEDEEEDEASDEEASRSKKYKKKRFDSEYYEKVHKKREWDEKRLELNVFATL